MLSHKLWSHMLWNQIKDFVLTLSQIAPTGKNSSQKSEKVFDGDSYQGLYNKLVRFLVVLSTRQSELVITR